MELTIMKPAVIEPSHMPRMSRTAKSPPKLWHAAWAQSATPHVKMLILRHRASAQPDATGFCEIHGVPHPLADGEALQGEVLRVLEH